MERRFGARHLMQAETFDADGWNPVTFTYNRDAAGGVTGVTMSCQSLRGPVTLAVPATSDQDDFVKRLAAALVCRGAAPTSTPQTQKS
jgi:hypothetical protein